MWPAAQQTQLRFRIYIRKNLVHQVSAALEEVAQRDCGNSIYADLPKSPVWEEKFGLRHPEVPCNQNFYDSARYWQQVGFGLFCFFSCFGSVLEKFHRKYCSHILVCGCTCKLVYNIVDLHGYTLQTVRNAKSWWQLNFQVWIWTDGADEIHCLLWLGVCSMK